MFRKILLSIGLKKKVNKNVWDAELLVELSGDDECGVQMTRLILSAKERETSSGADIAKLRWSHAFLPQK